MKSKAVKVGARNNSNDKQSIQSIHDGAVALGAECVPMDMNEGITAMLNGKSIKGMMDLGALEYARQEGWDIYAASQVLSQIAQMCQSEISELIHLDQLRSLMKDLCTYILAEIDEMGKAAEVAVVEKPQGDEQITATYQGETVFKSETVPAQVKENDKLDLSYVKSLHIEVPENKLAVKYVGKNTIAHPVFIWGDAKKTDLEIEFFNQQSDFWDKQLEGFERPLTWEHGQDELFKEFENNPVIGKTVKFYDDAIARWAESVINTDKQYRKYIDQFIEEKRLGYSSDSAPQYVQREKTGKATWLKAWPWFGGSLTASPCEPRMKLFTPEFLKSLGIVIPDTHEEWDGEMAILDYYKQKYITGE